MVVRLELLLIVS